MKKIFVLHIKCSVRIFIIQQLQISLAIASVSGFDGVRQWFATCEMIVLNFKTFVANYLQNFCSATKYAF